MTQGVPLECLYVVQQLNQRKMLTDENLLLVTRAIDADSNEMARYMARYGAEKYYKMVIIRKPVGRIYEIWSNDMGLGPVGDQFVAELEENLEDEVIDEEIIEADEYNCCR